MFLLMEQIVERYSIFVCVKFKRGHNIGCQQHIVDSCYTLGLHLGRRTLNARFLLRLLTSGQKRLHFCHEKRKTTTEGYLALLLDNLETKTMEKGNI